MGKIKVATDFGMKEVKYHERLFRGIYFVEGNDAKQNCKKLEIKFNQPTNPNEVKQRVTKIGKHGILSIKLPTKHIQYIMADMVSSEDIENLLSETPPAIHRTIKMTYNLIKVNNMDDFNLHGDTIFGRNEN